MKDPFDLRIKILAALFIKGILEGSSNNITITESDVWPNLNGYGLETQCCNDEIDNDGGETMAMTLMMTRLMSMPLTRGTARY